jgi:hypothetical protein
MSEYQYYEFATLDHALTERQMRELRALSTRARITPTSFVNDYAWGSFKGNEDTWMEKYFDAFLYLANWGTHALRLRLPAGSVDPKTARLYCSGECASVREKKGKVMLTFVSEDGDGGEWVDGEGQLSSMISVRSELASGDLRCLYLGWLLNVQHGDLDDDDIEPPVPPGLSRLSASLESLAAFLRVDPDLLDVAARTSLPMDRGPSLEGVRAWVSKLSAEEKNDVLARIIGGSDPAPIHELRRRFAKDGKHGGRAAHAATSRRTVGTLLRERDQATEKHQRIAAENAAKEKTKRERKAALARKKHLDEIAGTEHAQWRKIETLIATKQPKSYDRAVALLMDLRDLADREDGDIFRSRLEALRAEHSRKPTLIQRMQRAGL